MKKTLFVVAVLTTVAGCTGETEAPDSTGPEPTPAEAREEREERANAGSSETFDTTTSVGRVEPLDKAHDNPVF